MNKYVVMINADDTVIINSDNNKEVKMYFSKGYKIVNRIKSKHPLEQNVLEIMNAMQNGEGESKDEASKPRGKEYCYYCTVPTIALGDYVKAPVTPQSENDMPSRKGIVTKINVPEQEIEPFKQYAKTITERID